jgi:Tetraspanin family
MLVCFEKRIIQRMLGLVNYLAAASGVILLLLSVYGRYVAVKLDAGPEVKLTILFTLSLGATIIFVTSCKFFFGRTDESYYMTAIYSHIMMAAMTCAMAVGAVLIVGSDELYELFYNWVEDSVKTKCSEIVPLLETYVSKSFLFVGSLLSLNLSHQNFRESVARLWILNSTPAKLVQLAFAVLAVCQYSSK